MTDEAPCVEYLLSRCPRFAPHWEEHRAWWGNDAGLMLDLAVFGEYAARAIERDDAAELAAIADAVEHLVTSTSRPVQEAAVIGLLGGLTQRCRSDKEHLPFERLARFLGPAALAACRKLDENLGIRTPGVWGPGSGSAPA
jgi:hypothetical protein